MITVTELQALITAWEKKVPGSGFALHDAMEELGWPWSWKEDNEDWELFFPGGSGMEFLVSLYKDRGYGNHWTPFLIDSCMVSCQVPSYPEMKDRYAPSIEDAKERAEKWYKNFLREGGGV